MHPSTAWLVSTRLVRLGTGWPTPLRARPRLSRAQSSLPSAPVGLTRLQTTDDMRQASTWLAAFERVHPGELPRGCIDISYSRSSGPGGQNVNKVSTKATVRLALAATRPWYPPYALAALVRSPHFTASTPLSTKNPSPAAHASHPPEPSGALLVSASEHRTQPQNLASALAKLKVALVGAARVGLVGETSAEQKERVKGLVARDKRKVENVKRQRKDVKTGRRAGKGGWD